MIGEPIKQLLLGHDVEPTYAPDSIAALRDTCERMERETASVGEWSILARTALRDLRWCLLAIQQALWKIGGVELLSTEYLEAMARVDLAPACILQLTELRRRIDSNLIEAQALADRTPDQ